MDNICEQSARWIASSIREGEVTSLKVVTAYLDRIDEVNPKVNTVVQVARDRSLKEAVSADK